MSQEEQREERLYNESKLSIWLQEPLSEDAVTSAVYRGAARVVERWEPERARAVAAELVGLHCFCELARTDERLQKVCKLLNRQEAGAIAFVTGCILENTGERVTVVPAEPDRL